MAPHWVEEGLLRVSALLARGDSRAALEQARGLCARVKRRTVDVELRQLALPLVTPSTRFWCDTCRIELSTLACVVRQQKSDAATAERAPRTHRGSTDDRGVAAEFVSCRTDRCAQGRAFRLILGEQDVRKRRRGWIPLFPAPRAQKET